MFKRLREDLISIKSRDPAAKSSAQIILLYSGFHAVVYHRIAHFFHVHGRTGIARWISQQARFLTGVEIHPGATIGKGLFIDHGTGVVIGETSEIGDHVTLYQGVTLGGTGKDEGKRHPTVLDGALIGAGAKVLGPVVIGKNAKIAAGAVVLHDIPDGATAVGVPAKVSRIYGEKTEILDHIHVPDPVSQEITNLQKQIQELKNELKELKEHNDHL